jgi:hypothetical protein
MCELEYRFISIGLRALTEARQTNVRTLSMIVMGKGFDLPLDSNYAYPVSSGDRIVFKYRPEKPR